MLGLGGWVVFFYAPVDFEGALEVGLGFAVETLEGVFRHVLVVEDDEGVVDLSGVIIK